jgi:hypothetical protein
MTTAVPNATPLESRRLSIRLDLPLWILVPTFVLPFAAVGAGEPAAEEFEEESAGYTALRPEQQVKMAEAAVSDAIAARKEFDTLLGKKIAAIDRVCVLTDAQKQKLQLARRGDNIRFNEVERLRRRFTPGLREDGSLLAKALVRTLTTEQLASYEPLRAIFRVGGVVQTHGKAADEVLEVNLNFTATADDELAHLSKLPGLQRLRLDHTKVTDTGLEHLTGLTGLRELDLTRTAVTDAGLRHLQGLAGLRLLDLECTQVSDAGVAELQRALPRLKIEK